MLMTLLQGKLGRQERSWVFRLTATARNLNRAKHSWAAARSGLCSSPQDRLKRVCKDPAVQAKGLKTWLRAQPPCCVGRGRGRAGIAFLSSPVPIELNGPLPAPTVFSVLYIAKGPKPAPSCRLRLGSPGKSIARQAGDPTGGGPVQTFRPSCPPPGPSGPWPPARARSPSVTGDRTFFPGPPPAHRSLGLPGNRGSAARSAARDAPRPGCSRPSR